MSSRLAFSKTIPRVLALLLIAACGDQRDAPLSVRTPTRTQLSIAPRFVQLGADRGLPINRIRLTARDASTDAVLAGPLSTDVDESAAEWHLTLDIQLSTSGTTNMNVAVELIHSESGTESIEWSGLVRLALSQRQLQQVSTVQLYRGPPGNLTITAVRVTSLPPQIIEGSSAALTATIEGGSGDVRVFWGSLDPTIATVGQTGVVQGVLPGKARIVAVAGPRADTALVTITQRIASVQLTPSAVQLTTLGAEAQFQAGVLDPRNVAINGAGLTWSIANPAVAENLGNGRFRARANGSTTVTAASQAQPAILATAQLTVGQQVVVIDLSPAEKTLTSLGAHQQFTAVARDGAGNPVPGARFNWSSSASAVATIDANGIAAAIGAGTTTIRATTPANPSGGAGGATAPDSVAATATLRVSQSIALVDVRPQDDTLFAVGDTLRLSARAFDGGGVPVEGRTFTWTSTNAGVVSVDATGKVTAVSPGEATIRAETGGVFGSTQVVVAQRLTHVSVLPVDAVVTAVGQRVQFNALARDRYNNVVLGPPPTWSSAIPGVATITESGLAIAQGFGSTTIAATINGMTGYATLTVRRNGSTVVITPSDATLLNSGDTLRLAASVRDSLGALVPGAAVRWTTFDLSVAEVSPAGLVTARNPGTVTVMATSGNASGTATITVASHARITTVSVDPTRALLPVGQTLTLSATARDVQNSIVVGRVFTWTSSDTSIATVSTSGLVNGRRAGSAIITAAADGARGTSTITVYTQAATLLAKESGDLQSGTVNTALANPLVVKVTDAFGNPVSGQTVQWVVTSGGGSATPSSALSAADGLARTQWTLGATPGSQRIEARAPGLTGSPIVFTATATPGAVATVSVAPSAKTMTAGDTATFIATAKDAANNMLAVTFAWSSSDSTVARVDGNGRVTAFRVGTATIRATSNGKTGSAVVTVNAGPPALLSMWSGNGQAAVVNTALHDSLRVRVTDVAGNPIRGVTVQWVITSGGGSTSVSAVMSDSSGIVSVRWTLGATPGTQTLEARVPGLSGSPAMFYATASSGGSVRKTWIGGDATSPTSWSVPANWSPAGVPTEFDTAFIQVGPANGPALTGNALVGTLIVQSGISLDLSGYQLTVRGNVDAGACASVCPVVNVGSILMTGSNVTVKGGLADLEIQGTAKPNGAVSTNNLTVNGGNITLNGFPVSVGGNFIAGGGTLTMSGTTDRLTVLGKAQFYNIDETGLLTGGTISVAGDFDVSCYTGKDFVSTGTHLLLNGSAPQALTVGCSSATSTRMYDLTLAGGANASIIGAPIYITSALSVSGTLTINSDGSLDVAGPAGSVVINSGGVLNNNGVMTANLPITNRGTLTGNAVVQR